METGCSMVRGVGIRLSDVEFRVDERRLGVANRRSDWPEALVFVRLGGFGVDAGGVVCPFPAGRKGFVAGSRESCSFLTSGFFPAGLFSRLVFFSPAASAPGSSAIPRNCS